MKRSSHKAQGFATIRRSDDQGERCKRVHAVGVKTNEVDGCKQEQAHGHQNASRHY